MEDFSDLPFDVSRHAEALTAFAALNLTAASLRPMLRARELVFFRFPSCQFRIGVTPDPTVSEKIESDHNRIAFEVICRADSTTEAESIRHEVERYFLRHYPGRTLRGEQEHTALGNSVTITCFCV